MTIRIITVASVLTSLLSLPVFAAETKTPVEVTSNLPSIFVTDITVKQLTDTVLATGTIKPVEEVFVQPLVEGLSIEAISAEIGDRVEKNQVLASLRTDMLLLEKGSLEANHTRAKANLEQLKAQLTASKAAKTDARRQYERTKRLTESGSSSKATLEQAETAALRADATAAAANGAVSVAEADIVVTEAKIDEVALRLERTRIKAPVSGIVSDKNAKIGAIASGSSNPMFTIIQDGAIELVAQVPEGKVMKVSPGQKAEIALVGGLSPITGTVRLVSPIIDETTRLGDVYISIDNPQTARSGMYASAEIIVKKVQSLALPLTAVNVGKKNTTVRRVNQGIVEIVDVNTGIQDGEVIEILDGLSAGDQVVAKAGAYVREGDKINPVPDAVNASN